jgi:uncharacterized heparinase superfamily protein
MWLARVQRAARKPPSFLLRRGAAELRAQADRFVAPRRGRTLDAKRLAERLGFTDIEQAWETLAGRPYATFTGPIPGVAYESACPGDLERIVRAAENAAARRVTVFGGPEARIAEARDWHVDHKTGRQWPLRYCRDIDYTNLDEPSDVKNAWEISRLQWLIAAGQAFRLTREDRFAHGVRDALDHWAAANPYAIGVNWACTMEPALRLITMTWLFHACHDSESWRDDEFRARFLTSVYLHTEFTDRYFEWSDVNGNHCTACAAGLVFGGLFFGRGEDADRWQTRGWRVLCDELPKQVFEDGVDFEASVPYHRLVTELFFLPALYRERAGHDVPQAYRERLLAMARFIVAYSRGNGSVPLWGDADDARTLPFGAQETNDHRYLAAAIQHAWGRQDGALRPSDNTELVWLFGPDASHRPLGTQTSASIGFPVGGFFVMRNARDHVFIDCGPVGLAGRGGHGHNDCLSFEAVLDEVHLVTDCGAYVYTASPAERNAFRSTDYHNTPRIDGEEINRFIAWNHLWNLHDDAKPVIRDWHVGPERDRFQGAHTGYQRLAHPVTPVRTITLEHSSHTLTIEDSFEGHGHHEVEIPLHLAVGVTVSRLKDDTAVLSSNGREFTLSWHSPVKWAVSLEPARVSPTYGVVMPSERLVWKRTGPLASMTVRIQPNSSAT